MSNFLEDLILNIRKCVVIGSRKCGEKESPQNWTEVSDAIMLIDSLGENARRMLEIGIIQDELIKLGFVFNDDMHWMISKDSNYYLAISFDRINVNIICPREKTFSYPLDSPTWQQDLLTKVKELINHE